MIFQFLHLTLYRMFLKTSPIWKRSNGENLGCSVKQFAIWCNTPLIGSHPQQLFIGNGSKSWMYGRFDGLRLILRLLVPNYFLFFLCYCYSKKLFNLRPPLLIGLFFLLCVFLFSPSVDFNNSRSVAKGNWFQRPRLWKINLPVDGKNVAVDIVILSSSSSRYIYI